MTQILASSQAASESMELLQSQPWEQRKGGHVGGQLESRLANPHDSKGDGKSRAAVPMDSQALEDVRQGLNEALKPLRIQLNFSQDKDLEQLVVKVMNHDTGEVIRQLPPENMLQMARRMEELTGLLLNLQL